MVQAGVGGDPDERTLEFTDVAGDARRDELERLRRHRAPVAFGLVAEDRETGLEVGWLDVGDQAPLEPATQPLLEGRDRVGHAVARHHDLLVRPVERVERVEELLLESFLALHELDVVDEQHVDVAVAALEVGDRVGTDAVDVLVQERLGAHVAHDVVLVVVVHVVADGVQQVRLAETRRAVDEQRVVAAPRGLGHAERCGERELVRRSLHEGLEGVPRVQAGEVERLVAMVGGRRHPAAASIVAVGACFAVAAIEPVLAVAVAALHAIAVVGSLAPLGAIAIPVGPVAAIPVGSLAPVPAFSAVGRPDPARVAVEVERFDELHLHHQLAAGDTDLLHRVAHEREVTRQDAVARVPVRCAEPQQARVALERHDVLEGGEPDGLGDLGTQELGDRCPHLFRVAHLHLLPRRRTTVHIVVHNCGRPPVRRRRGCVHSRPGPAQDPLFPRAATWSPRDATGRAPS